MTDAKANSLLYGIDDIPPPLETVVLSFQHYLTMFGSTVAIPLLLAPAFGITNPVEKGWLIAPTFAISSMAALANSGWEVRIQHVQGAIIAGSFFEIVIEIGRASCRERV